VCFIRSDWANSETPVRQNAQVINSSANDGVIGSNPDDDRESSAQTEELPPEEAWIRRSFWVKTLQDARRRNTWVRVNRLYTDKTAAQVSSDLRAAHHRDATKLRVKGILPGDRWDTRWNASPEGPEGQYSIWIRFIGDKM